MGAPLALLCVLLQTSTVLASDATTPAWGEPLRELRIDADDSISDDAQSNATPLIGQPLGEADAEALRIELTRRLVERGYVNSGYVLHEPAFRDGVLHLRRVAGRVVRTQMRGNERLRPSYVEDRLIRSGEAFNTRVLGERFRLLLNDPLFKRINASIIPGTAPGEAVLDLAIERDRVWSFALEANNYRPQSIGEYAALARMGVRNLTGRGDALSLGLSTPVSDGQGGRVQVGWQLPLGARGLQLALNYDEGNVTVIEQSVASLDIKSRIRSLEAGLSYPLLDDGARRLAVSASVLTRHNRTQILGEDFAFQPGEPDGGSRVNDIRLQGEYAQRSDRGLLLLRGALTVGRNNIREVPFPEAALADDRYQVLLLQGQYGHQLSERGVRAVARGTLQATPDRLVPLERIAVGGSTTVRGFLENTLVRDQAAIVNLELEVPILTGDGPKFTLIPFVDHASAGNRGEADVTLTSAGLASRTTWRGARFDLAWGHTLDEPADYRDGRRLQGNGVHFSLGYAF